MDIEVGRLVVDLTSVASTATARHDAIEVLVGGPPTTVIHDQPITTGEARLSAELGVMDGLTAGLILPLRLYHTRIRYLDQDDRPVEIENPFIHHRNETLVGVGDPWLYARGARAAAGFTLGARLGVTVPLGRTEEDPFALGDLGMSHQHSQFGTGTFGLVGGIDVSRTFGGVRAEAGLLTIQSFYENQYGYQAGDRYAALASAATSFGTKQWRFRATFETIKETAERWSGVVHTDDGNIGRTDILLGAEVTWLVTDDWHVGVSAKLPAYTHVVGGQLDALGFVGVSVGARLRAFGGEEEHHDHGDEHDHGGEHAHDHGDHDDHDDGDGHDHAVHDDAAPVDWSGLDKVDVITDGSVKPLVPVLGKITVFDFWAAWCAPCKDLDRELARVARARPDAIAIRKIDVVDVDSPANKTFLGEATLPHVKVYGRDGKLLWERSAPPRELAAAVEAAIGSPRKIAIEVNDDGYLPARIEIERGAPVTLVFKRTTDHTCATDVHFTLPDGTKIDRELPLGVEVELPLRVEKPGEIRYSCGMDMFRGTIVVR